MQEILNKHFTETTFLHCSCVLSTHNLNLFLEGLGEETYIPSDMAIAWNIRSRLISNCHMWSDLKFVRIFSEDLLSPSAGLQSSSKREIQMIKIQGVTATTRQAGSALAEGWGLGVQWGSTWAWGSLGGLDEKQGLHSGLRIRKGICQAYERGGRFPKKT